MAAMENAVQMQLQGFKKNFQKVIFSDLRIPVVSHSGQHCWPCIHISLTGRALIWSKVRGLCNHGTQGFMICLQSQAVTHFTFTFCVRVLTLAQYSTITLILVSEEINQARHIYFHTSGKVRTKVCQLCSELQTSVSLLFTAVWIDSDWHVSSMPLFFLPLTIASRTKWRMMMDGCIKHTCSKYLMYGMKNKGTKCYVETNLAFRPVYITFSGEYASTAVVYKAYAFPENGTTQKWAPES